jgi:hypothetical protein
MCLIYIFHLLAQITAQMEHFFNNETDYKKIWITISLEVMPFRSFKVKRWDLRNWIETGNEGIFRMRICRDVYKDLFRNS